MDWMFVFWVLSLLYKPFLCQLDAWDDLKGLNKCSIWCARWGLGLSWQRSYWLTLSERRKAPWMFYSFSKPFLWTCHNSFIGNDRKKPWFSRCSCHWGTEIFPERSRELLRQTRFQMCLNASHHSPTHLRILQHGHKAVAEFSKTPCHAPQWRTHYWSKWKHMVQGAIVMGSAKVLIRKKSQGKLTGA